VIPQSSALKIDQTKNAQVNLAFFLIELFIRDREGLPAVIPQSSALKIVQTKKRSSELGVFSN